MEAWLILGGGYSTGREQQQRRFFSWTSDNWSSLTDRICNITSLPGQMAWANVMGQRDFPRSIVFTLLDIITDLAGSIVRISSQADKDSEDGFANRPLQNQLLSVKRVIPSPIHTKAIPEKSQKAPFKWSEMINQF